MGESEGGPKMVKEAVAIAVGAGVPVLLWGPPGSGKTSFLRLMAESLGLPIEVVIASIREPSDFSGLPVLKEDGVRLEPPAWAKRLAAAGKGILFLDEISTAPPAVQAALLRVVLDRVVGDLPLPPGVTVVAAANPPDMAAGGVDLSLPLANRFLHVRWRPSPEEISNGFINGWSEVGDRIPQLSDSWVAGVRPAEIEIGAFLRAQPEWALKEMAVDPGFPAYPTPRTWAMAARVLVAASSVGAPADVVYTLLSGCVGDAAATEFLSWRREQDLPPAGDLLDGRAAVPLDPNRPDRTFAALAAMCGEALRRGTPEAFVQAWRILYSAKTAGAAGTAAGAAQILRPFLGRPEMQEDGWMKALREVGPIIHDFLRLREEVEV
ncbi:MAG: MoxR family ATPase [Clostridiales bacterium]|nr:MoxR family ATPase [Clostridiales bacterium]